VPAIDRSGPARRSGPGTDPRPSDLVDAADWERAHHELVEDLRELIRIPSVNPPPAPGDGELRVARRVADVLAAAGVPSDVLEPVPGRGSVVGRLHGDGTGGDPLLLLSHLDVVPAAAGGWSHDPFGADLADGYVWGRGAVDMKGMVAMEVAVIRRLAAEARAAGRDPASDPIPGLTRDVLFAATADEEAGGHHGAGWIVDHDPDRLRAAGALNECGGVSLAFGGRRFYPIGVAEKGYANFRITVRGTWAHGSMPRPDNAAVRAAAIVSRLAEPGPARLTPAMTRFFAAVADELGGPTGDLVRRIASPDGSESEAAIAGVCDAMYGRAVRALLRDTASPNVVRAGVKYNVIPGVAEIEVDCRTLPGTDEAAMRDELRRRIGEGLWAHCDAECFLAAPPIEAPLETELYRILEATVRDHDPEGVPVPVMAPFATDAKHTARLAVPTYGFSPLRLAPDERFLERFHGVDERVGLDALRFGLPVLYDVVRRFCG
jgi:acetylornithine deacetylase/succinyl-diaminopimelate desuccinylase-like protein